MQGISPLRDTAALRGIEARASAALGDAYELMRRAGQAAWRHVREHWPQAQRLLVVCGPGNNGGDGYVLARQALMAGRQVRVVRLDAHAPRSDLALRASLDFEQAQGRVFAFDGQLPEADLIIDALFGIGLTRAPDAPSAALIAAMNTHGAPVFSLDVPSGVDADRGHRPGDAVRATRTLEFLATKPGLRTGVAVGHVGAIALATLDIPESIVDEATVAGELIAPAALANWLRPRDRNTHKGANGRVLCMGGDHGSGGALLLCAEAALRCGAGLVDAATRERHVAALLARLPEALAHVPGDEGSELAFDRADVVAVGPGLGQGSWGRGLFTHALAAGKPLVLDADALNLLATASHALPGDAVITPHPGEAARLLGCDIPDVQQDRIAAARRLAQRFGCTVVLKGAGSVVAASDHLPRIVAAGNPGMAVGGMGDVLTGAIAALRAQGLLAYQAASAGALLHAAAGDAAAAAGGERGLLPSDLMPWLRRLSNPEITA